ncbi:MAG: ribose-phosphate pyrophosphokinase [Geminicoccaceae bacterium]|nr:MAG: ribose-phosphate pyrophosphokinase [Geminicoccaceae bacterium]
MVRFASSSTKTDLTLLTLAAGRPFAARVATALGTSLGDVEERVFEDGEVKVRPLVEVRGQDVAIVQSLDGDAHDRLIRVAMLVGAVRDAGAARIIGCFPYLAYARKDRRTKPRDPLALRYVAQMLEAVGLDTVMALEVHDLPAFENAFRIPSVPLDMRQLFVECLAPALDPASLVVVSPDPGGLKRAQLFQERLSERLDAQVPRVVADKRRTGGVVSGERLYGGDVAGLQPIIVDDLISSGGTIQRTAKALTEAGARPPIVAVAHGVFGKEAGATLGGAPIARLLVTDSIDPPRIDPRDMAALEVVSCAPLVAAALGCVLKGGSISRLLGDAEV